MEEDKLNLARTETLEYENVDNFSLDFKTKFFELVSGQGPLKLREKETSYLTISVDKTLLVPKLQTPQCSGKTCTNRAKQFCLQIFAVEANKRAVLFCVV